MRAFATIVALAAASQVLASAPANWERASSPDGAVSVMSPCSKAELNTDVEGAGFRLVCRKGGMIFVATSGMAAGNGKVTTFDEQLAGAHAKLPSSEIDETPMFGHRAFKIVCGGREGVACVEIVDWRSGSPLMVAAIEEGGPGTATAAELPGVLTRARSFYDSLEVAR